MSKKPPPLSGSAPRRSSLRSPSFRRAGTFQLSVKRAPAADDPDDELDRHGVAAADAPGQDRAHVGLALRARLADARVDAATWSGLPL